MNTDLIKTTDKNGNKTRSSLIAVARDQLHFTFVQRHILPAHTIR